jgi:hypothetical protein
MAITSSMYSGLFDVLFTYAFKEEAAQYAAQLISDAYTFSSSHSTRAEFKAFVVGTPVLLTGKTVTTASNIVTVDCDDIDFTAQGTLDAAGLVIFNMPAGFAQDSDPLCFYVNFDNGVMQSVDRAVPLTPTGLLQLSKAT